MTNMLDLNFRLVSGKAIALSVPSDKLISHIKTSIARECDIAAENQRLIFRGQLLNNERTIGSYYVETGDTIHVVGNASANTGDQQQTQTQKDAQNAQNNKGKPPFNFGETVASSMGMLMREFLTNPGNANGPLSGLTAAFADGAFQTRPTQTSNTSDRHNVDWTTDSEGTERLLRQSMQFAQQLSGAHGELGDVASKLLSGVMGGFLKPEGRRSTHSPQTASSNDAKNSKAPVQETQTPTVRETHTNDNISKPTNDRTEETRRSVQSAVTSAKDTLNRVCDSLKRLGSESTTCTDKSDKNSTIDADIDPLVKSEANITVKHTSSGSFLSDSKGVNSMLPWTLLHSLEKELDIVYQPNDDNRGVNDFMKRYRHAQTKANHAVGVLEEISDRSQRIDLDTVSQIAVISSIQAALQSEIALIAAVLCKKASQAPTAAQGSNATTANAEETRTTLLSSSSTTLPSTRRAPLESATYYGDNTSVNQTFSSALASSERGGRHGVGTSATNSINDDFGRNLSALLSSFGQMPESAMMQGYPPSPIPTSTYTTSDDVLLDSTWLRRQFNQYFNSTGFKSRMDDLVRKTKNLSDNYCKGTPSNREP
ncbi:uncharacterized protein BXIN_0796 [Babesia sp. Xinjiang]|uniref:uncharacterized protein n=1 Tax=Babesia sp. Xinjiang TaxID=462227 RepID=UPI000A266142|nr:uncharacterized protein BXIN_0796 [Babesia sp. Xinjiang]ORM41323.1 hypothetical protein BXIN_0796 [Babesia sp. Xinjiang]